MPDETLDEIRARGARYVRWTKRFVFSSVVFSLVTLGITIARGTHADPKPGIWQEQVTTADGVTIRKLRDTTGGDFNVCYVASRYFPGENPADPRSAAVSIACVPERKP